MRIINFDLYKKIVVIILIMFLLGGGLYIFYNRKNNYVFEDVIEGKDSMFAIMLCNKGTSNCSPSSSGEWPGSDYVLRTDLSSCIDNQDNVISNSIVYENGKVKVKTTKSVGCYLYFEKSVLPVLTLSKSTGIKEICYKVNGASTYTCEANSVSKQVNYGSSYSFYGVPEDCYTYTYNSSSNYASGTMNSESGKTHSLSGTKIDNLANCIKSLAKPIADGGNGVISVTHNSDTIQTKSTTDYRFIGSNPDNYVCLGSTNSSGCTNEENLYRIVGVFETQKTLASSVSNQKNEPYEWRVKLIKYLPYVGSDAENEVISGVNPSGKGYRWTGYYENKLNNWNNSKLNYNVLNNTYLSSISGYTSYIGDSIWYLGTPVSSDNTASTNVDGFYSSERGTQVYSGNPYNTKAKIGLIYPSDYGYSTSGNSVKTRNTCWSVLMNINEWGTSSNGECKHNSWISNYKNNSTYLTQWTISPTLESNGAWSVVTEGQIWSADAYWNVSSTRPAFYLNSNVKYSGFGTITNPYTLSS